MGAAATAGGKKRFKQVMQTPEILDDFRPPELPPEKEESSAVWMMVAILIGLGMAWLLVRS